MGQDFGFKIDENNASASLQESNNLYSSKNQISSEKMHYLWIDKSINEKPFELLFNEIFNEERQCLKFNTVAEGIEQLFTQKYKAVTVIISGSFFLEFYKKFDERIHNSKDDKDFPFPIVVVFCRQKENFIFNLKFNNNYDNNYLLNEQLIFNVFDDLVGYINGVTEENLEDLTFDEVKSYKELIIPCFYSYLIEDVTKTEIDYYNYHIINNYHDSDECKEIKIKALIRNLQRIKTDSKKIISEKWLKIYSMESDFFSKMNKIFRRKEESQFIYYPLIKICYEGIRKNFLECIYKNKLYRGSHISKKELEKLKKKLEKKKEFPKVIVYSRCFLSFSEKIDVAQQFLLNREGDNNTEKILYEIEEIKNENIDKNTLSNCSLKNISYNKEEEEVLFFPFSCFEVVDIKTLEYPSLTGYRILLKYLGRYGNIIKEEFRENFFEHIERTKYSDDLIKYKITKNNNFISSWEIERNYKNKYEGIIFSFAFKNKKEILISKDNSIFTLGINSLDGKKFSDINIADNTVKIVSLIKLDNDRILFSTSNNFIQIIIFDNGKNFQIEFQVYLNFPAYNLLYLKGEIKENNQSNFLESNNDIIDVDQIFFSNNNCIYSIYQKNNEKHLDELVSEDSKIISIKGLPNNYVIYLTKDNSYTFINFLDIRAGKKDENKIKIQKQFNNYKNLAIFQNYCIAGFDNSIELIDYNQKKLICSFYFENNLIDIINLENQNILIILNDDEKNNFIIRELKINYENGQFYPNIVSEGKIENKYNNIIKIIEINSSTILLITKNGTLLKLEKKNEFKEIFQEAYNKYNNNPMRKKNKLAIKKEQYFSFIGEKKNIPIRINQPKIDIYQINDGFDSNFSNNNYIYAYRRSNSCFSNQKQQNYFNDNIEKLSTFNNKNQYDKKSYNIDNYNKVKKKGYIPNNYNNINKKKNKIFYMNSIV